MFSTNLKFYMGVLFTVVILGLGLNNFAQELQDSSYVVLSGDSIDYINDLNFAVSQNSINDYSDNTQVGNINATKNLLSQDDGTFFTQDVLTNLNFFRKASNLIWKPLVFVFGTPSFIAFLLSLNLEPFSFAALLINTLFFVGIIVLIIKEILK